MDRTDITRYQLLWWIPWTDNIDRQSQETTDIKVLKEILESLKITEEFTSDKNRTIEPASEEMSTVPTPAVYNKTVQAVMLKSKSSGPKIV